MTTPLLITNTIKKAKANSPEILTGLGVAGVLSTAYLSARGGFKAAQKLESEPPNQSWKEKGRKTWTSYIPATASGALTISCIILASKGSTSRVAAAATAYSLSERAFSEYRDKVAKQIGDTKEQDIRDELAQEKIDKNPPPPSPEVVIVGPGQVLCCELHTGRYFRSDMETLRKAANTVNSKAIQEMFVNLDEFYYLVGLEPTSQSAYFGWDYEKVMELRFSTCMAPSGEPCLAFDYSHIRMQ